MVGKLVTCSLDPALGFDTTPLSTTSAHPATHARVATTMASPGANEKQKDKLKSKGPFK